MNNISHHFRIFNHRTQFVYFSNPEQFTAREQSVKKEVREAADDIKDNLETMTVEDAVKAATDKINALEKTNADWYVNNKTLLSIRGNDYLKKIYDLCGKARQLIRNRMEDFKFTRGIIEDITKRKAEAVGLQPEYDRLAPIISKTELHVEVNSSQGIEDTYSSLDNFLDMKADAEKLYRSLAKIYHEINSYQRWAPKSMQASLKPKLVLMKTQIDTLRSGYTTLVTHYNAGINQLRTSINAKVEKEEANIREYRNASGTLQEKAKSGGVKGPELEGAYKKYTDQKSYSQDLSAFRDVLAVYKPLPTSDEEPSQESPNKQEEV